MNIVLISKIGHHDSGVGRYSFQLIQALEAQGLNITEVHPSNPLPGWLIRVVKNKFGWDLFEFFNNYPIWSSYPKADLYHLTSQNLATLLIFCKPPGPTVVTVHDLFPYLLNQSGLNPYPHIWAGLFDRLSCRGLRRAGALLTISSATLQAATAILNIPVEKFTVIPEGVS